MNRCNVEVFFSLYKVTFIHVKLLLIFFHVKIRPFVASFELSIVQYLFHFKSPHSRLQLYVITIKNIDKILT